MGVVAAMMVGLGSMIGGSVFATMGPAVKSAGAAAPLAFIWGVVPACFTACAYLRLTLRYPGEGGTEAFFNRAFGGGYLSASLNLLLVVCYASVASLYAGVFGVYLAGLLRCHELWAEKLASCLGVLFVAWMNLTPRGWALRLGDRLNAGKLVVMGIFVVAALCSPLWRWENFEPRHWGGLSPVLVTGLTIFMSYQGFELIAAIRQPIRRPERTLPWAFAFSLFVVTLYYSLMAFCTLGHVDYASVNAESGYLVAAVAERFMGVAGGLLLSVGALVASCSAMNSDVRFVSTIPGDMAQHREMPRYFSPRASRESRAGVLFLCGLMVVFVLLVRTDELSALSSLGFLVIYALVNAVSLRLCPRRRRDWLISGAGALLCLCSVGVLVWQLAAQPRATVLIAVTVCMLLLPFVWQALYRLGRCGAQR